MTALCSLLAVMALGLAKGGFVGIGLSATPILALTLPPLDAVAVLVPVMLAQDVFSVVAYRRAFDPWNLRVMAPGVVVGILAAWLTLASISHVRLLVGLTLLWLVLTQTLAPKPRRARPFVGTAWGAASGFAGLVSNAGSIGFLMFVLPQKLPPVVYAGTMAMFFALVDMAKLPPLFAMQQFNQTNLLHSAALIPLALFSNWVGIILVRRIPKSTFYRAALIIVAAVALWLVVQDLGGF